MSEIIFRFFIGGVVVSLFAMIGDILRPKSFAGLFGAAPSIALATIGLAITKSGIQYAAIESKSMLLGAIGFFLYTISVSQVLRRYKPATLVTTIGLMPIWFGISFGLWFLTAGSN
jgi:hypothetical protein